MNGRTRLLIVYSGIARGAYAGGRRGRVQGAARAQRETRPRGRAVNGRMGHLLAAQCVLRALGGGAEGRRRRALQGSVQGRRARESAAMRSAMWRGVGGDQSLWNMCDQAFRKDKSFQKRMLHDENYSNNGIYLKR
jgi:hypothetical protein